MDKKRIDRKKYKVGARLLTCVSESESVGTWHWAGNRAYWKSGGLKVWLEGEGVRLCTDVVRENCRKFGVTIADVIVHGWRELYIRVEGAEVKSVRLGRSDASRRQGEWRFIFRNYLGKSAIHVTLTDGRGIVTDPIEVVSLKTPLDRPWDPLFYPRFLRALLNDLARILTTLPFESSAPTAYPTEEFARPPAPVFVLHVLVQYADTIRTALQTVLRNPHRRLVSEDRWVHVYEADTVDADTVLAMVHHPEHLHRSDAHRISRYLRGFVPRRVFEHRVTETFDTPENRFIRHFIDTLLFWCAELQRIGLASGRGVQGQLNIIIDLQDFLRFVRAVPLFADVGAMVRFPASSQVLMKRDGYRECLQIYRLLHLARIPFFERLQDAIDNRQIDVLYEYWCFFRLAEVLAQALGGDGPRLVGEWSSERGGLRYGIKVRLPQGYEIAYNRTFRRRARKADEKEAAPSSYSISLRPDFSLLRDGQLVAVLDAKFRFDEEILRQCSEQAIETPSDRGDSGEIDRPQEMERWVVWTDLVKMHAYRDALGCPAAVVLYPGNRSIFYRTDGRTLSLQLQDFVSGSLPTGIGAIPFRP